MIEKGKWFRVLFTLLYSIFPVLSNLKLFFLIFIIGILSFNKGTQNIFKNQRTIIL